MKGLLMLVILLLEILHRFILYYKPHNRHFIQEIFFPIIEWAIVFSLAFPRRGGGGGGGVF